MSVNELRTVVSLVQEVMVEKCKKAKQKGLIHVMDKTKANAVVPLNGIEPEPVR